MILELSITGLGIIQKAHVELNPGLVIVTGETGAGKTLLLDAVRVAAGDKPSTVNQQNCDTHVDVLLDATEPNFANILKDLDVAIDEGAVTVSRTFPVEGRAKTFLGGRAVPAPIVVDLSQSWLAIHGQHDSQRLLKPHLHRDLVDRYAGEEFHELLERHKTLFKNWKFEIAQLEKLRKERIEMLDQVESFKADIQLIESMQLSIGEDITIAATIDRISRVESVRSAIELALASLEAEDFGVTSALKSAQKSVEAALPDDAEALHVAKLLSDATMNVAEALESLRAIESGLDIDPDELDSLMLRQRQIKSLVLRHGPTIEDVLAWRDEALRAIALVDPNSPVIAEQERKVQALETEVSDAAHELSSIRVATAKVLGQKVTEQVRTLALDHALCEVQVSTVEHTETGWDRVEILFTANPGVALSPLALAASGGELSRMMLALEIVLSDVLSPSVMVFDEVDAGVAGAAALSVGSKLALLAQDRQVLVVTHLPQIAAFADQHIHVEKQTDGTRTITEIRVLEEPHRLTEISRMLAGVESSDSALAHAAELLTFASERKASYVS